jgi:hypothetical protein
MQFCQPEEYQGCISYTVEKTSEKYFREKEKVIFGISAIP